ncbi:MAG: hypothetical protein JO282_04160 [Alphaproteobacteria bacterium]|nr:hypothetical protein [Alphaproteobacteria bacterium]
MRAALALARCLVVTAIPLLVPGAFAADPSNLGLPDVTVTAPPITPSWKKWSPYSSNPRVEKDKWPEIPCGAAKISSVTASTCKTGPLLGHEGMGLPAGNLSIDASNCRMGHDLVITNLGNLVIEADVIVVDPNYVSAIGSQHKGCYAQAHYSDLREDFPDMNQITRKGSGWRDYLESGDLTTMAFSVGSADCRAVEKRGPTWLGGHVYVIHASVCRKDGRSIEAADLNVALGSLRVQQYESRGNLRAPPQ